MIYLRDKREERGPHAERRRTIQHNTPGTIIFPSTSGLNITSTTILNSTLRVTLKAHQRPNEGPISILLPGPLGYLVWLQPLVGVAPSEATKPVCSMLHGHPLVQQDMAFFNMQLSLSWLPSNMTSYLDIPHHSACQSTNHIMPHRPTTETTHWLRMRTLHLLLRHNYVTVLSWWLTAATKLKYRSIESET